MKEPNVGKISFAELAELKGEFGLVALGAGGDLAEWVDGIANELRSEKLAGICEAVFSRAAKLTGNVAGDEGRIDLVLVFAAGAIVEVGKLALWRIRFGDISWIDDFLVNYAEDYK